MAGALVLALGGCGDGKSGPKGAGSDTAATTAAGDGGDVVLTRDDAIGALYGAPGPRTCSTFKVPAEGPPSADTIAKYVICGQEYERPTAPSLYLLDQVRITGISDGRPYNVNEDVNMSKIDTTKPVYDIEGSLVSYTCNRLWREGQYDGGDDYKQGTQCSTIHQTKASGLCYINTLHEWSCSLLDVDQLTRGEPKTPPPPAD
ncbi:MAG: hypothetical protein JWP35_142 [Caulobacter sp.]|nr:hypothetical protein [Caulobacter sp.]